MAEKGRELAVDGNSLENTVGEEKRGNHFLVCVGCEHLQQKIGIFVAWGVGGHFSES